MLTQKTEGVVTMEQHPLVVMVVVLISDLLLPVSVTFPQLLVYHLLNLWDTHHGCFTPTGRH